MLNWLRKIFFAEERIEMPDGETYVRRWPTSEKKPRPSSRWRRHGHQKPGKPDNREKRDG